eukprot:CAMPEP_0184741364 /NCGR_PEP_ID=MMETSP0315-20130426/4375_1 /TAXON_ID=101924 /ORGANISM="Rhodosorus marinus, Strain UTEX LB 2760" /LENGTH=69 /DNA_ID=CAMNT_0027211583 /DNA_START=70 /DNA_END=279 /DNA_ORIENTATION=-
MVHFSKESEHKLDEDYMHDNEHHRLPGVGRLSDLFHRSHDEDHEEAKDKKSMFSWLWVDHNPYKGFLET